MNKYGLIKNIEFDGRLIPECPMDRYTSFRIGGRARALVDIESPGDIVKAIRFALENGLPYYIIGNGTNILVKDEGYDGIIIRAGKGFSSVSADGRGITAEAGALLPQIANAALASGLAGFEFAAGIPGSAGGALAMNAGAYGGEMADVVKSAEILRDGEIIRLGAEELGFSHRRSAVSGTSDIVLRVEYALERGDPSAIKARMDELREARASKQPLNLPSAGSAFKRPAGGYASRLIDECGLKGFSVGGARVSEKHAGFIVNMGGATAGDVIRLTEIIISAVREKTGITLEREFIFLK